MQEPARVIAEAGEWLAGDQERPWTVTTSGSTGTPRRVLLSRSAVTASIELSARRIGAAGCWLLMVPPGFVAGLNVITRSLAAGHSPVVAADHPDLTTAAEATLAAGGDAFCSMVPTQLRRVLEDSAATAAFARFHTVLVGGGPVDPALRERAAAAGIDVLATYGSAETCGGVVYDGLPLDGVGLAVADDGRVRLSGPTLFDGYQGDPEQTDAVLHRGWFTTSDAGRIGEDGRLRLLGRIDDMVVTGGVNVPGGLVARRLREHAAVREAEVVGVPDPEWGNRLAAFVVAGGRVDRASLRDWVAREHPRAWAPRQVVLLDELPLLENGKPDRLALRRLAEEDG